MEPMSRRNRCARETQANAAHHEPSSHSAHRTLKQRPCHARVRSTRSNIVTAPSARIEDEFHGASGSMRGGYNGTSLPDAAQLCEAWLLQCVVHGGRTWYAS